MSASPPATAPTPGSSRVPDALRTMTVCIGPVERPLTRRQRAAYRLRETVLWAGAVAGVVCVLATLAALLLDVRPVVFRSGSMAPAIETGALALSREVPADELRAGDVVTVQTSGGVNVTHRIVTVTHRDGEASLVLQGDANRTPDEEVYVVDSAARVLVDLPNAGYVVTWLTGSTGVFLGGLLVGSVLLLAFRPGTGSRPGATRLAGAATVAAVAVGGGTLAGADSTLAYYEDAATLTSGVLQAAVPDLPPAAPRVTGCTRNGNSITLEWEAASDPQGFQIRYENPGTEPVLAGSARSGSTQQANFNNSTGSVWVVALNDAGESPKSNEYAYAGNGSKASCEPVR